MAESSSVETLSDQEKTKDDPVIRPPYLAEDPWKSSGEPEPLRDGKHWRKCRETLTKFDLETTDTWRDEIQTQLLVVSGASNFRILCGPKELPRPACFPR